MEKVAEKRDTIPCPRAEEHEPAAANDDWLDLVDWQARRVAAELMILRANVEVSGQARAEEWAAVEEPLRELWRAVDAARGERRDRPRPPESGTRRRARRRDGNARS